MAPWRLWLLARRSVSAFLDVSGTRLAAAISYYALLALFPLVIVLVAGTTLVVGEADAQERVIARVVEPLPLTPDAAEDLRESLRGASQRAPAVGVAGLLGLLWTASGMMGAIRTGLSAVAGAEQRRPFLRGKLVDLAMVAAVGLLFLVSAALTVTTRVAADRVLEPLGVPGAGTALGILAPMALAAGTLAALIRFVPALPPRWPGVWRAALAGAVALWALATGFAVYLDNFARYNAVYGSLGAVVALLVFVYLAAMVLLLAGALAARWEEVAAAERSAPRGGEPALTRARRALSGLVARR